MTENTSASATCLNLPPAHMSVRRNICGLGWVWIDRTFSSWAKRKHIDHQRAGACHSYFWQQLPGTHNFYGRDEVDPSTLPVVNNPGNVARVVSLPPSRFSFFLAYSAAKAMRLVHIWCKQISRLSLFYPCRPTRSLVALRYVCLFASLAITL